MKTCKSSKMIKSILSGIVLLLCFSLGLFFVNQERKTTYAAAGDVIMSGSCGDAVNYTLTANGTNPETYALSFTGSGAMTDYGSASNVPWKEDYAASITSVTIDSGITSIAAYALYGCKSLTSIDLPDSLTDIGQYAFTDCKALTEIEIPSSVITIGQDAFWDASSLSKVTFAEPCNVTTIATSVFKKCSALTEIEIPSSVTTIGERAF